MIFDSSAVFRRCRLLTPIKHWSAEHLFAGFAALILVCAILLSTENAVSIGYLYERNYNEGWNVYNAARLINLEQIYDNNYWRVNNYPIGSFLVVAGANFMLNNLLLSGRIVALVSFAAIGVLAAVATRRFGGERIDAVFGAGCALGFCYLIAPAWIFVDDPQTLGEAIVFGGLVSHISQPPDRRSLLRTALLVVLGGFTKQNVIAIPIAITLDVAIRSPRRLPFWIACCAGFVAGLLGLTQILAGGSFIDHLLSPRIFIWHGVTYHLMNYLRLFKIPLITIVLGSRLVFTGRRFVLVAWGVASLSLAAIFSGFEGTSYNMFQDTAVFLGVATGVTVCELRRRVAAAAAADIRDLSTKLLSAGTAILLTQPIWARAPNSLLQISRSGALLASNGRAQEAFLSDARYVAAAGGPAICESLLLCYVAGQPFTLDAFNSRQYILAGKLDQAELIRRIADHEFSVIQLRADVCDDPATAECHILHYPQKFNRFTDDVLYAIDRHYQVGRRSRYGSFYIPK